MILQDWAMIEADFQREYHIDLRKDLFNISWPRFILLISGLSPESITVRAIDHKPVMLEGAAAEAAVDRYF